MALRPVWRGHLRLALVSCPVALFNARHERNAIRFNLINPATGNRIRMMTLDAGTEQEVQRRDLVKGYEFKKDNFILLSDEDLDSVKVESSSLLSVEKFVDAGSIDPIYFDSPYYLAPDGQAGRDVYHVLRDAIAETGRLALSRAVIGQRERVIAIRPYGNGLAAHTLSDERDLNDAKGLFDDPAAVDPEMVKLAVQLIDRQTGQYDPADTEDRYETRLRAMIDAKLKGEGLAAAETAAPASNVVDLMAALKRSLGESEAKPPPETSRETPRETKSAPETKGAVEARPAKSPAAKAPRKRA